jgi:hypothetical protein
VHIRKVECTARLGQARHIAQHLGRFAEQHVEFQIDRRNQRTVRRSIQQPRVSSCMAYHCEGAALAQRQGFKLSQTARD